MNNKCLSPTKENANYQIDQDYFKANKSNAVDLLKEIVNVINSKGINLPSHIQKKIKAIQQQPFIKLKPAIAENETANLEELKKLRIKINDAEFQRKKMQEDLAQFKLVARVQKERQIKKWQQSYNHLKQSMEDHSQDSLFKLKQAKQESQRALEAMKTRLTAQMKQQRDNLIGRYQKQLKNQDLLYQRQIKQQKQAKLKKILQIQTKNKQELQKIQENHSQQLKKISLRNKNIIQAKQKQYESKIIAIISQKKTQQKLHQQTKLQFNKIKQKLYNQLYYQKKLKNQLQDQLKIKQTQIRKLNRIIDDLKITIDINKNKYQNKIQQQKQKYNIQLNNIKNQQEKQLKYIKQLQEKQLSNIQQKIQELENVHQQRQQIWQHQNKNLVAKFDERPSKKQDLQMIESLKSKILRKQQQIKYLNKQLKHYVLELENKQQTYTRIFASGARIDKKSLTRQDRQSKDNLNRKSQTTDFKFLLKVYNKQF